jgi:hypothetical protein
MGPMGVGEGMGREGRRKGKGHPPVSATDLRPCTLCKSTSNEQFHSGVYVFNLFAYIVCLLSVKPSNQHVKIIFFCTVSKGKHSRFTKLNRSP